MRNLLVTLGAVAWLAACGPSGRELAVAKTARYQGDKLVLFSAAKNVTESKYKLAQSDETTLAIHTIGRWYTPDGLVTTSGEQDIRQIPDKSILFAMVVKLLPETDKWIVHVEPAMLRYNRGMPNPEKLSSKDPSVPGWATGKVDQLAFDIYTALKPYQVGTVGGMAPPAADPAPAPVADPVAPTEPSTEPPVEPTAPAP